MLNKKAFIVGQHIIWSLLCNKPYEEMLSTLTILTFKKCNLQGKLIHRVDILDSFKNVVKSKLLITDDTKNEKF